MNLLILKKCATKIKCPPLYTFNFKQKFRRLTQDGLTRYNWDEFDRQNGSMQVI